MTENELAVGWPVSHYTDWIGNPGQFQWMAFKLKSGAFYIDILEALGAEHGFDRLTGVEMALDGALSALSGAYDAAVAELIESIERHCAQDDAVLPWMPIPEHEYGWIACDGILKNFREHPVVGQRVKDLRRTVRAALKRSAGARGWLTELRDLRNRSTHRTTLKRNQAVFVGSGPTRHEWSIIVGDGQAEDPVRYLRRAMSMVVELTSEIVTLASFFSRYGVPTPLDTVSSTVQATPARASAKALPVVFES